MVWFMSILEIFAVGYSSTNASRFRAKIQGVEKVFVLEGTI
jgi:hypothetical protein